MGITTLLVITVVGLLAMVGGVTWLLWGDASTHRRRHTDLRTCEAIWALTADR